MSRVPHLSRRTFLASAAAVGGALALGFDIPLAPRAVRASDRDLQARLCGRLKRIELACRPD